MSILTENSRKMLVESMRECLSDVLHESTSLTSKQATEKIKFVTESATYEQLLNITMNPHRQEKYLPAYVLEGAVAILHSACMTGRKNIGVNAITEGALKLQKKTGAVITESMLDAALTAVKEGCGLKVVGKILNEAYTGTASGFARELNSIFVNPEIIKNRAFSDNLIARLTDPAVGLSNTEATTLLRKISTGELKPNTLIGAINLKPQMSNIESRLNAIRTSMASADAATRATLTAEKNVLTQRLNQLKGAFGNNLSGKFGSAASGTKTLEKVAGSKLGNAPWGKIALGAAAVGGLGALGWKYWKNKKAMQQDMANGTSPY